MSSCVHSDSLMLSLAAGSRTSGVGVSSRDVPSDTSVVSTSLSHESTVSTLGAGEFARGCVSAAGARLSWRVRSMWEMNAAIRVTTSDRWVVSTEHSWNCGRKEGNVLFNERDVAQR